MKKRLLMTALTIMLVAINIKANNIDEQLKTLSDIKYTSYSKKEFEVLYRAPFHIVSQKSDKHIIDLDKMREAEKIKQAEEARKAKVITQRSYNTSITSAQVNYAKVSELLYNITYFERIGVIRWGGYKFTYYSERVLPGGGLKIPGRHTRDGFVRDENGYIVAAQRGPKGGIIPTPFGSDAKIYDYCEGCTIGHIDLYTR